MSWQGLRDEAWERVEDLHRSGRPGLDRAGLGSRAAGPGRSCGPGRQGQRSMMGWFYSPSNSSGQAHGMRPFVGQLNADQEKELLAL